MRLENRVFAIVAETDDRYAQIDPDKMNVLLNEYIFKLILV